MSGEVEEGEELETLRRELEEVRLERDAACRLLKITTANSVALDVVRICMQRDRLLDRLAEANKQIGDLQRSARSSNVS